MLNGITLSYCADFTFHSPSNMRQSQDITTQQWYYVGEASGFSGFFGLPRSKDFESSEADNGMVSLPLSSRQKK